MIRHPCILGGPQRQARGAKSEVSPAKGNKIKSGCLTLAFLGAHKRAEMLCHPCIGWGKIGLRGGGVVGAPFPDPPPPSLAPVTGPSKRS